ncbi:hypothetical protein PWE35_09310 [Stenotrophomonas maltophilia]|uniref:hypothetical protein n=1 Tax=Stenotrophomonas maltophilia TaxID=40324 RepID=UPI00237F0A12|nr:hypothetical protein [Stenotrophomonas maltophilia]WDW06021.1 hypothetical protein PWE35_09310 [Stenotrophomonas maltophilia]
MADLDHILSRVVGPGLALLPSTMDTAKARVLLLAIGLQESRFETRRQIGGPARGYWQFEKGGGVVGVLTHPSTRKYAAEVCRDRGIEPTAAAVYPALERDDLLACAFARLLLFTDPKPIPDIGYVAASWDYYVRNWRPGKPHRSTWDALYAKAVEAVS